MIFRTRFRLALAWFALGSIFVTGLAVSALADLLPTHVFAQREKLWGPKLSLDGSQLAVLERKEGDEVVSIYRRTGNAFTLTSTIPSGTRENYFRVRWANNGRLLVSSVIRRNGFSSNRSALRRLVSMNLDGSDQVVVLTQTWNRPPRFRGDGIIHMLPQDPSHVLIRLVDISDEDDSSVYRMNIYSGKKEMVEEAANGQDIYRWYADWDGNVRYAFGQDSRRRPIMLIRRADGQWHPLHKYELFEDGRFHPLGYSINDNTIYVLSSHVTGRASLYKFDLRTGDLAGKVFTHDEVDLDSLVVSEAQRKAVAVSYTLDKKEYHYLDPTYAALRRDIDNALPGRSNAIVSATPDEQLLVVLSESPVHAGTYYLYDLTDKSLTEIGQRYDGFRPDDLSPMRRVTYEARDSLQIPAYLTVPRDKDPAVSVSANMRPNTRSGPAVILPHGGPRSRDRLDFDLWAQFLANRGYVVLQPNFRGSRGYGEWYESLGHGTWGRAMQNDLADGARWLVDQGLADPNRICIAGGSYGGYASLMAVVRDSEVFQCAASLNGVSDVRRMLRDDGEYDSRNSEFKRVAGRLTKSELDLISPIDRANEITAPVLLVHGEEDQNVSIRHSRQLANKLENAGTPVTFIPLPGEGHTLLKEESYRVWLSALEEFLAETIGPDSPHARTDMTSLDE